MLNPVGIESEPFYLNAGATVVGVIYGVVQKEFRTTPRRIDLNRNHLSRSYQDAFFMLFGNDQRAFRNT